MLLAILLWAAVGTAISPLVCAAIVALPQHISMRAQLAHDMRGPQPHLPIISSLRDLWRHSTERRANLRRLVIELAMALIFGWLVWRHGAGWVTFVLSVYAVVFILVVFIDLEHHLILNVILAPAAIFALLVAPTMPDLSLGRAIVGAVVGFLLLLIPALIMPGGLGAGDVKLAGFLGLAVGFPDVLTTLLAGIVLGGLATLGLLLSRRISRRDYLPYGPFLITGAILVIMTW
jgi:leader peptidase (prepilin peptidase)/N-methyltransferase